MTLVRFYWLCTYTSKNVQWVSASTGCLVGASITLDLNSLLADQERGPDRAGNEENTIGAFMRDRRR